MSRAALGVAAVVGLSAAFAACTVNFEGKRFCRPDCTGVGGGDTGTGGNGGFSEASRSATGTGGSTSQGGGGDCGGKAVAPSSDAFGQKDMPPAMFWTQLFPERSMPKMVQENDALLITPTPQASWYTGGCTAQGCGAPAVVQRISGNFTMKTHVAIVFTANGHADPFAAAGILLADPCGPTQNNVVWDLGYQDKSAMGTELTQTIDGSGPRHMVEGTNAVEADLYACRVGNQFYFYVGKVAGVSPPSDMPDATVGWSTGDLDVGLTAHIDGAKQVIQAQFHSVTFAPAMTQDDCTNAL